MTDRFNGLIVAFDKDIREDDAKGIINAIRQLRGVAGVEPNVTNAYGETIVRLRLDTEWRKRIYAMLDQAKDT